MSYFGMGFGSMDSKPHRREYRLMKVKQHLDKKITREKYNFPKDEIKFQKGKIVDPDAPGPSEKDELSELFRQLLNDR